MRNEWVRVIGRWAAVVRRAPFKVGYLYRLEDGMAFLGPLVLSVLNTHGKFAYYWAPTRKMAIRKVVRFGESRLKR